MESVIQAPGLASLRGVGPRLEERLARMGLITISDLLLHLPLRYQDRCRLAERGALLDSAEVLIRGRVCQAQPGVGRRRALVAVIECDGFLLTLRFFHYHPGLTARLTVGTHVQCFGQVRLSLSGFEMVHPEFECFDPADPPVLADHLTPVYPSVAGLHQAVIRRLVDQAIAWIGGKADDELPSALFGDPDWPGFVEAVKLLHHPPAGSRAEALLSDTHPARLRLACEELVAHQLACRRLRRRAAIWTAPAIRGGHALWDRFAEGLSFALTGAQQRVIEEIKDDLAKEQPMHRLVQGDVGSGKTVVAAAAVVHAVSSGYQVAIMAPTELLAEQHLRNFRHWLEPLGIEVGWLSGRVTAKQRTAVADVLADGSLPVLVGTHALFQEGLTFARLGLVVIDEQHRFGVQQRLSLLEKGRDCGTSPHLLIMTATPIPRTLMMTAYADLDCSVIDELPPGRKPVETVVLSVARRDEILARVRNACVGGRQVYWVCTLIEANELLQCQAAEDSAKELTAALPKLRVGLIHGRLKGDEKAAVMADFRAGEIDVLVATTVIEVGVDVPNASVMIIENAERLGLSQLHQLRGRIGRGDARGVCVLLYQPPLSEQGRERLAAMRETHDGFEIARRDLELRGPGELLGKRQAGYVRFKVADLVRDQGMIRHASRIAGEVEGHHEDRIPSLLGRWLGDALQYRAI
ncbi:MAG: ATP-dependent DNA helicase RecG [Gammaproteobacteria bacterium]|nr:ATP-dependent DNA helicase RecG [Gammaproteobacteria bacterium]